MKRAACLQLLLAAAGALAGAQNVRITWIGQSCFVIQTEGGPTVVTDPPVASTGYPLPALTADVVTVSHNHTDHNYTAGVGGQFTLVDGRPVAARTEMTAAQMPFLLLPGWHDNQKGAQRGQNTMIRRTQSGIVFAHMGDFGQDQLSDEQLAGLRDADVLFVPSGGFYTVDAGRAAALGETEVLVGGKAVPLMMASPSQINLQLPAAQQAGQAVVEVRVKGERVARGSVTVLEGAPGLFALGRARVRRGEAVEIHATGAGRVTPPVEDGAAAPVQPLSFMAGLWQVNAAIPADASPGPDVSVLIIHAGLVGNQLSVAVE